MKRYSKSDIIVSAICLGFVVAIVTLLCVLRVTNVLSYTQNPYSMLFGDLVLGTGLYVLVFGIDKKLGVEYSVGAILIAVASVLFTIRYQAHLAIIIIAPVIVLLLAFGAFVAYKYLSIKSKKNQVK